MQKKVNLVFEEIEYRAKLLQNRLSGGEIRPLLLPSPLSDPWRGVAPVQLQQRRTLAPYPKSILFLCSDNLTRGPLAEALFIRLLFERNIEDQWFVRSGGLDTVNDQLLPMDERVVKYLAQKNIFPGLHQSRTVIQSDFTCFNIIVCFDEEEFKIARHIAPESCIPRITLLGDFHPRGKLDFVGSKNSEGSEFRKWISCKEWRETYTSNDCTIEPNDLEDIDVLYKQLHVCCVRFLDCYLSETVPFCMCIYAFERQKFELYKPEKIFTVYSDKDKIIIKNDDGNEMEEEDEEEEEEEKEEYGVFHKKITGKDKDILNYYASHRICQKCCKKVPPKKFK